MKNSLGKKEWVFPDTELPPAGESLLKGHESIIILNMGRLDATVSLTLYFTDRDPVRLPPISINAERVRCLRMDRASDIGFTVPLETQYAVRVRSDQPVVVQYGRVDPRQTNLAYYTTMGYST